MDRGWQALPALLLLSQGGTTMRGTSPAVLGSTLVAVFALLVSGCAGTVKNMQEAPEGAAAVAPDASNAVIVFMRPSGMGFAVQSSVFEVQDGRATLVGIVAAKAKVALKVSPGKHLFMSVGESSDFMSVDVLPNRTYYAFVTPRMGLWKARFSLDPQRAADLGSDDFKKSLQECKWVIKTSASDAWAAENMSSIQSRITSNYSEWTQKPEAERPHLRPEDGI
jgi:hypothetical protein